MCSRPPRLPLLAAYDRARACELLRDWTAQGLRDALRGGHFGAALAPHERAELDTLLTAWIQRALGGVFLRDALLVDDSRGPRVFGLICAGLTRAAATMPPELAEALRAYGLGDLIPGDLADLAARDPALARLADLAGREGLALALLDRSAAYPPPTDLGNLLPALPLRPLFSSEEFRPPTGPRRSIAVILAVGGVAAMIIPMIGGVIPEHPAGLPLALLTLALMIGIKAGWAGLIGALCIWLVPNLPGFRHGNGLPALLPVLPLLLVGLSLLIGDRRVRALWAWVRRQIGR